MTVTLAEVQEEKPVRCLAAVPGTTWAIFAYVFYYPLVRRQYIQETFAPSVATYLYGNINRSDQLDLANMTLMNKSHDKPIYLESKLQTASCLCEAQMLAKLCIDIGYFCAYCCVQYCHEIGRLRAR